MAGSVTSFGINQCVDGPQIILRRLSDDETQKYINPRALYKQVVPPMRKTVSQWQNPTSCRQMSVISTDEEEIRSTQQPGNKFAKLLSYDSDSGLPGFVDKVAVISLPKLTPDGISPQSGSKRSVETESDKSTSMTVGNKIADTSSFLTDESTIELPQSHSTTSPLRTRHNIPQSKVIVYKLDENEICKYKAQGIKINLPKNFSLHYDARAIRRTLKGKGLITGSELPSINEILHNKKGQSRWTSPNSHHRWGRKTRMRSIHNVDRSSDGHFRRKRFHHKRARMKSRYHSSKSSDNSVKSDCGRRRPARRTARSSSSSSSTSMSSWTASSANSTSSDSPSPSDNVSSATAELSSSELEDGEVVLRPVTRHQTPGDQSRTRTNNARLSHRKANHMSVDDSSSVETSDKDVEKVVSKGGDKHTMPGLKSGGFYDSLRKMVSSVLSSSQASADSVESDGDTTMDADDSSQSTATVPADSPQRFTDFQDALVKLMKPLETAEKSTGEGDGEKWRSTKWQTPEYQPVLKLSSLGKVTEPVHVTSRSTNWPRPWFYKRSQVGKCTPEMTGNSAVFLHRPTGGCQVCCMYQGMYRYGIIICTACWTVYHQYFVEREIVTCLPRITCQLRCLDLWWRNMHTLADDEQHQLCTYCRLMECKKLGIRRPDFVDSSGTCAVCNDITSSHNFGAMSCKDCAGFFRRTHDEDLHYKCEGMERCRVDMETRSNCDYCRLQRCHDVGMCWQGYTSQQTKKKVETTQGPKKRYKSWVWTHMTKIGDCAMCNLCEAELTRPDGSTNNMISHLQKYHRIVKDKEAPKELFVYEVLPKRIKAPKKFKKFKSVEKVPKKYEPRGTKPSTGASEIAYRRKLKESKSESYLGPHSSCQACGADNVRVRNYYGGAVCKPCANFFMQVCNHARVCDILCDGFWNCEIQAYGGCRYCHFKKCIDAGMKPLGDAHEQKVEQFLELTPAETWKAFLKPKKKYKRRKKLTFPTGGNGSDMEQNGSSQQASLEKDLNSGSTPETSSNESSDEESRELASKTKRRRATMGISYCESDMIINDDEVNCKGLKTIIDGDDENGIGLDKNETGNDSTSLDISQSWQCVGTGTDQLLKLVKNSEPASSDIEDSSRISDSVVVEANSQESKCLVAPTHTGDRNVFEELSRQQTPLITQSEYPVGRDKNDDTLCAVDSSNVLDSPRGQKKCSGSETSHPGMHARIACPHCNEHYTSFGMFCQHAFKVHLVIPKPAACAPKRKEPNLLACFICNIRHKDYMKLHSHLTRFHKVHFSIRELQRGIHYQIHVERNPRRLLADDIMEAKSDFLAKKAKPSMETDPVEPTIAAAAEEAGDELVDGVFAVELCHICGGKMSSMEELEEHCVSSHGMEDTSSSKTAPTLLDELLSSVFSFGDSDGDVGALFSGILDDEPPANDPVSGTETDVFKGLRNETQSHLSDGEVDMYTGLKDSFGELLHTQQCDVPLPTIQSQTVAVNQDCETPGMNEHLNAEHYFGHSEVKGDPHGESMLVQEMVVPDWGLELDYKVATPGCIDHTASTVQNCQERELQKNELCQSIAPALQDVQMSEQVINRHQNMSPAFDCEKMEECFAPFVGMSPLTKLVTTLTDSSADDVPQAINPRILCDICGDELLIGDKEPSSTLVEHHIIEHGIIDGSGRESKDYPCSRCDFVFPKLSLQIQHEEQHKFEVLENHVVCEFCDELRQFETDNCARVHMYKSHLASLHILISKLINQNHVRSDCKLIDSKPSEAFSLQKPLICDNSAVEDKKSSEDQKPAVQDEGEISDMEDERSESPSETFKCDHCNATFPTKMDIVKHIQQKHDEPVVKSDIPCSRCSFVAKSRRELDYHKYVMHQHTPVKQDQSQQMAEIAPQKIQMISNNHPMSSTTNSQFCEFCQKPLAKRTSFGFHMEEHRVGLKPHTCSHCTHSFDQSYSRDLHELVDHLHIKPFICPMPHCRIHFKDVKELKAHTWSYHSTNNVVIDPSLDHLQQFIGLGQNNYPDQTLM